MVECTALEMRHRCKPIGGSNPSLSAIIKRLRESPVNQALLHARRLWCNPGMEPDVLPMIHANCEFTITAIAFVGPATLAPSRSSTPSECTVRDIVWDCLWSTK